MSKMMSQDLKKVLQKIQKGLFMKMKSTYAPRNRTAEFFDEDLARTVQCSGCGISYSPNQYSVCPGCGRGES